MYKLEVKLKQHTPLIHFQHDQEGATLRASEVKPKLDRFILTKLGESHSEEQKQKGVKTAKEEKKTFDELNDYDKGYYIANGLGWIAGKRALNYKMKFIINEEPKTFFINQPKDKKKMRKSDGRSITELKTYPLFFANLDKDIDDDSEYKKFCFLHNPFKMELFLFDEELQNHLKTLIEKGLFIKFFSVTNFGTRQSKGFGSFFVNEESGKLVDIMPYRFFVDIPDKLSIEERWEKLFVKIELFYKVLRSGINLYNRERKNVFYMKPLIFQYAKSKDLQWDKKSIKQEFLSQDLARQKREHPDSDKRGVKKFLFKDMLGLSPLEDWRSYRKKITNENREIDRFQSPVIFKPIEDSKGYTIYFKGIEILKEYKNKPFTVKVDNKSFSLTTYPDFDIDKFLDFAIFDSDLTALLGKSEYEKSRVFEEIIEIFDQIKRDYQ
jgi:hypothetical protein